MIGLFANERAEQNGEKVAVRAPGNIHVMDSAKLIRSGISFPALTSVVKIKPIPCLSVRSQIVVRAGICCATEQITQTRRPDWIDD